MFSCTDKFEASSKPNKTHFNLLFSLSLICVVLEDLFNNALIDLETDFKPEPSVLVDGSFLEVPLETLPEGRIGVFLCVSGDNGCKIVPLYS